MKMYITLKSGKNNLPQIATIAQYCGASDCSMSFEKDEITVDFNTEDDEETIKQIRKFIYSLGENKIDVTF